MCKIIFLYNLRKNNSVNDKVNGEALLGYYKDKVTPHGNWSYH